MLDGRRTGQEEGYDNRDRKSTKYTVESGKPTCTNMRDIKFEKVNPYSFDNFVALIGLGVLFLIGR